MRTIATIFINNILKQYKEQYYKIMNKNNMHNTNNKIKQYTKTIQTI